RGPAGAPAAHSSSRTLMQLDLSEEQVQIRDAVRELCTLEFAPEAADWDREGDVPRSAIETLAENGFLGMAIPEEWGGVGDDARTEREAGNKGLSAFIVERGTPGLVLGKPEDKMGLRGSDTIALSLENLRVPVEQRLGAEGDGFRIAMSMLDGGRVGVGAQALGVMRAAFEDAVRYAQQRRAFGRPLSQIQSVQFKLAEMERRIQCARLLSQRAAWLRD